MKVGDIVRLKSGGPKMTVVVMQGGSLYCTCQWFDDAGKIHIANIPASALERVI